MLVSTEPPLVIAVSVSTKEASPTNLAMNPNSRVGVTLQSSFLGFSTHAGFLNSLLDSGIRPDKISGASSGALVASAYAAGLEQDRLRDFVLDRKLKNSFWEWLVILRAPAVFGAYLGHGVVSGRRAIKHLRDTLPLLHIEDSPNAALSIGVTNLTKRQGQLVTRGEVAPYVIASCAVSPIIRAQEIDGELFLDGGFTDAAPFEHWIDDPGIDTIIIHNITFDPPAPRHWSRRTNFICCWAAVHHMVEGVLTASRIERAEAAGKRVIVHQTHTARPKFFDSPEQFEDNYETAYKAWQQSPKLSAGKPRDPLP